VRCGREPSVRGRSPPTPSPPLTQALALQQITNCAERRSVVLWRLCQKLGVSSIPPTRMLPPQPDNCLGLSLGNPPRAPAEVLSAALAVRVDPPPHNRQPLVTSPAADTVFLAQPAHRVLASSCPRQLVSSPARTLPQTRSVHAWDRLFGLSNPVSISTIHHRRSCGGTDRN
jgi:hypothetical protein